MTTSDAPAFLNATAAPMTTSGFVLMAVPGSYSTMFGLRNTRLPRTSTSSCRRPRLIRSLKSTSYDCAGNKPTAARSGRENRRGSYGRREHPAASSGIDSAPMNSRRESRTTASSKSDSGITHSRLQGTQRQRRRQLIADSHRGRNLFLERGPHVRGGGAVCVQREQRERKGDAGSLRDRLALEIF